MITTALMPIKLANERCPGKNTKLLGGKPLLQYELETLKAVGLCSSINVYCSSPEIVPLLPDGVNFILRPKYLDLPTSNFTQIFEAFMADHYADVYVYAHATAPYVTYDTMKACIQAVQSGEYDSAFCAVKIQGYLWQNGEPMNFQAEDLPRTQDMPAIYRETSGVYVFGREVFAKYHRRIGSKPFIREVTPREAVDIDTPEDFEFAEMLCHEQS